MKEPKPPSPEMPKIYPEFVIPTQINAKDIQDINKPRVWNEQAHKVDVVVHTPHGAINMNSQILTMPQIEEFRGKLRKDITNPHGYLEMKMTDGLILIPHELLVASVIQLIIDRREPEPLPPPEPETKTVVLPTVKAPSIRPIPPRIPKPKKKV